MFSLLEKIGSETLWYLQSTGRMGLFLLRTLASIFQPPFKIFPIIRQVHFIGAKSTFVILFTGAFKIGRAHV